MVRLKALRAHSAYVREQLEDLPAIHDVRWAGA